jgi:hypothetical protein
MAKRARKARSKARGTSRVKGAAVRKAPEPRVVLTALGRWETQLRRLEDWRLRVANADSMQGESWKRGQLRHIDALIATHLQAKPETV